MTEKERLTLAAWSAVVNEYVQESGSIIEKLESQVSSLEEKAKREEELVTSLVDRLGEIGDRLGALEQIYNKSKQAPPPWSLTGATASTHTKCQCSDCTPSNLSPGPAPKADPGPGFYYCPSCGTRQLTGAVHYCVTPNSPYGGILNVKLPPLKENLFYGHHSNSQEDGHVVLPRSAATGPTPPGGGQTEEEIRRAAHPGWFASGFTLKRPVHSTEVRGNLKIHYESEPDKDTLPEMSGAYSPYKTTPIFDGPCNCPDCS